MAVPTDPWRSFELDPRDPEHAALRAGDRDRAVVADLLHSAYAEGRLDRAELDERTDTLALAKTLGELPRLLDDLVPTRVVARPVTGTLAAATPDDLQQMAVERYEAERRAVTLTFAGISTICWAVAVVAGLSLPDSLWPLIVMAVLGLRVVRTVAHRDDTVRDEVRRLEKKQRRQLKPPEQPMADDQHD